jgi:hypothetical protein
MRAVLAIELRRPLLVGRLANPEVIKDLALRQVAGQTSRGLACKGSLSRACSC